MKKALNAVRVDQSATPFLRRQYGKAVLVKFVAMIAFSGAAARFGLRLISSFKNLDRRFARKQDVLAVMDIILLVNQLKLLCLISEPIVEVPRCLSDRFKQRITDYIFCVVKGQNLDLIETSPAHLPLQAFIIPLTAVTVKPPQRRFEKVKNVIGALMSRYLGNVINKAYSVFFEGFLKPIKGCFSAFRPFPLAPVFSVFHLFRQGGIYA